MRTRSASRRWPPVPRRARSSCASAASNGRIDKGRRVLAGGAVGMILYNHVKQDQETDNHYLPAIHVDGPTRRSLAFVNGHTNVMATWAQGTAQPGQADMMASFSSRGPLGDWIKPDVTAPGVQVLAGMTPQPDQTTADNGPPGNLFQAIAGTSMSSPHAAGVSALVKASHPSWTPAEIKSALMTSSVQTRRQGRRRHPGGRVRHGRRLDPRRPRGQPDARLQRDLREHGRRGQRHAAPHRPEHPEHRRNDDERVDHDAPHRDQRLRQEPDPRRADHGACGRHDHGRTTTNHQSRTRTGA